MLKMYITMITIGSHGDIHCLKLALMGIYSYSIPLIPLALPQDSFAILRKHREGLHYASTSAIVVWVQTYHPHSSIALQDLVFRCYT
jgi:hypothetical protein